MVLAHQAVHIKDSASGILKIPVLFGIHINGVLVTPLGSLGVQRLIGRLHLPEHDLLDAHLPGPSHKIEGLLRRRDALSRQKTRRPDNHTAFLPQVGDEIRIIKIQPQKGLPLFGVLMRNGQGQVGEVPPDKIQKGLLGIENSRSRRGQTHLRKIGAPLRKYLVQLGPFIGQGISSSFDLEGDRTAPEGKLTGLLKGLEVKRTITRPILAGPIGAVRTRRLTRKSITHYPEGVNIHQARAVCARCPVQEECLEYALKHNIEFGVWGGMSRKEREQIARKRGIRVVV